jgi:hypothetical protein
MMTLQDSLRDPGMKILPGLLEDLVKILVKSSVTGPCMKILKMACIAEVLV